MKTTDLERAIQQQNQIDQQRATAKAIAGAKAEWYERQALAMRKIVELLPFPGSQGNDVYQDHLRAAAALFFGLGARYGVAFDDLVAAGKNYYDMKKEQVDTANRIETELNAAKDKPADVASNTNSSSEQIAQLIQETLDEERADRT